MSTTLPQDVDVSTKSGAALATGRDTSSRKAPGRRDACRSDAQRNRDLILDVALVELGANPDVALRTIARKARVGQGTLYRHFPDRESLLWAVHHHEVEGLVDSAGKLLERLPPLAALREWLREVAAFAIRSPGMGLTMHRTGWHDRSMPPGYSTCADNLSALLAANHVAGTVRPDVAQEDLLLAIAGLWQIADPEPAGRRKRADRLIDIVIDGITIDTTTPSELGARSTQE